MTGLADPTFLTVYGDQLVSWLVGACTFVSVLAVWYGLLERKPHAQRIRSVLDRRRELLDAAARGHRRLPKMRAGLAARARRQLKRLQSQQADRTRETLGQAGMRSRDALAYFLLAKLLLPSAGGAVGFIASMLNLAAIPSILSPFLPIIGVVGGFLAPDLHIRNRAARRHKLLQKALPDGLDLLVICAEAGLSLDTAMSRVAEEIAVASPELADELALTSVELNFLPDRRSALLNLARRCPLPAVRGVVGTLVQTERYGTPLAQSLRVLSSEFREQRMLRAEAKAARLPAVLTVPMIVFILPTLFIVLIGPAMIDLYDKVLK